MQDVQRHRRPYLAVWAALGGILAVLQGTLGLLFYSAAFDPVATPKLAEAVGVLSAKFAYWLHVEVGKAALVLLLGVVLTVAAVGVYSNSRWACRVAFVYCVAAVVLHSAYLLFELLWVAPTLNPKGVRTDSTDAVTNGVVLAALGFVAHAVILWELLRVTPDSVTPETSDQPRIMTEVSSLPKFPGA